MRGVEHDGDAGLLFMLLPHADEDDAAAAAAALFPVDEAARITVGRNAVGVIGMVSYLLWSSVGLLSEHRRQSAELFVVAELLFFGGNQNPLRF